MAENNKLKGILNKTYSIGNAIVSVIETFFFIGVGILLIIALFGG